MPSTDADAGTAAIPSFVYRSPGGLKRRRLCRVGARGFVRLGGRSGGVLAAAAFLAACGSSHTTRAAKAPTSSSPATVARAPSTMPSMASSLSHLSLRQLAGQRVIYAYRGLTPPATLLERVRHGEAAGVIFFSNNIANDRQLRRTIKQLQSANAASPVHAPLLMMADQEGGQVRRVAGASRESEKEIGQSPNPQARGQEAGQDAGRNLKSVGLNVNLAPVLDV